MSVVAQLQMSSAIFHSMLQWSLFEWESSRERRYVINHWCWWKCLQFRLRFSLYQELDFTTGDSRSNITSKYDISNVSLFLAYTWCICMGIFLGFLFLIYLELELCFHCIFLAIKDDVNLPARKRGNIYGTNQS